MAEYEVDTVMLEDIEVLDDRSGHMTSRSTSGDSDVDPQYAMVGHVGMRRMLGGCLWHAWTR